ncbi:MAG TPA: formate C-acetyltransferase/glycerol dehydratase family glycyl radical enzyme [Candidatus Baltobacteraceae bacterium]|nr:formate C-acetyltransferase/glycerol dehydratase family glycyl radical enzyme [Candidatus Baltobacteraceae bacterium]
MGTGMTTPEAVHPQGTTPRIGRLRQRLLSAVAEIATERAVLITESYRATEAEPIEIRRAKALDTILRRMTLFILEDELIVGHLGEKHRCAPVHPEVNVEWIVNEDELASFQTRRQNRLLVPEAAKQTLREIAPYWRDRSLFRRSWAALPESVKAMRETGGMTLAHEKNMLGHCIPDWEKLLAVGFGGLRQEVAAKLQRLDLAEPSDLAQWNFLRSLVIVTGACSAFIRRYADLARQSAATAPDPRRAELERIAEVCDMIAEGPATGFHEALQLLWFGHLITVIEGDARSTSYGRFDQYMWPYYERDVRSGGLSAAAALELLECFWIKPNEMLLLDDREHATYRGGYPNGWNLVVGGIRPDGTDGTNALSFMCLQAFADVQLFQPNFGVRTWFGSPPALLRRTYEVIALGTGVPQVFNDEVIVDALTGCGLPLDEARDYTATGCVEHATPKAWIRGNGGWINLAKAVEFALNDGRCALTGRQVGLQTGDPERFRSFPEFEGAVKQQLAYQIRHMVIENNIIDRIHAELVPELTISLLIHDCIPKGMSAAAGGGRYNFTSPMSIGVATLGDSLAAVKTLVYEQQRITMAELRRALAADFAGQEALRQLLVNRAPKFGNDNDAVDALVVEMQQFFAAELKQYRSPRGGTFRPGFWTVLANMGLGRLTGATPDGRKAREALSDSIGPSNGCDRQDTTAMLCSSGKIDQRAASNGTVLNLRLSPTMLTGPQGIERIGHLIRSYFDLGGSQLAINVVSTETLRDAQRHPERYRDLLVKVAGYAAFFVELGEQAQNEIIARNEHS